MASYVSETLLEDEKVVAMAKLHWGMYISPAIWLTIGTLMTISDRIFAFIPLIALFGLIYTYLSGITTELALTNLRVVAKTGIIRRNVVDVRLSKVEGVSYKQSIFGRLLGYGSIIVRGTGVGAIPIKHIDKPEAFKRKVTKLIQQ